MQIIMIPLILLPYFGLVVNFSWFI